jgi:hypothetical protein
MKSILRIQLVLLFLIAFNIGSKAQATIDETNLITRLSGLNNLDTISAPKYFISHNYYLFSKHTVPQATFSIDLYKYKIKDQASSYLLSVIAGKVTGSGYITYSEDEYQQALKTITSMGFVPGEATVPGSGESLYAKGNLRFLVQKKTAANNSLFYVLMLSDILKTAQLSGLKK